MSTSYPHPYTAYGKLEHHVLVMEAPGVLRVSFNRGKVNSWVEAMWREFDAIFRRIKYDAEVNAIVLTGENRCFTAGLDLGSSSLGTVMDVAGDDVARRAMVMTDWIGQFQDALSQMERCNKPVIAAVHNVAYGLAVDILSACDIRYASDDVRFNIKEVDAGLAADIGTLQRFPKIVANDSWVRELAYTAREFDAKEAFANGFISRIVPGGKEQVFRAAIETATIMAEKSPVALRLTKQTLLHSRDHTVQDGLDYIAALNGAGLQAGDIPEAMMSVLAKKKPAFAKL